MASGDLQVEITAIDRVTPVIRRIRWHMWLYQHGVAVIAGLVMVIMALLFVVGFLLGQVV